MWCSHSCRKPWHLGGPGIRVPTERAGVAFVLGLAKALRETVLGAKANRFAATAADVGKRSRLVVVLLQEFSSVGLDVACFDLADLDKEVMECDVTCGCVSEDPTFESGFETQNQNRSSPVIVG
ncbi:hypothetical protein CYMTET_12275 [Cymbomonas tetramitiformis]|uniref:Uncharacterized protein n=1 Tax=Cymbomonas tetramitiformis TaxID=36881 RepID=A0AAE0LCL2_9CHLO|nr:hypothetical protein CYMTET_12275 [Cymbomonas tetramitiformis]